MVACGACQLGTAAEVVSAAKAQGVARSCAGGSVLFEVRGWRESVVADRALAHLAVGLGRPFAISAPGRCVCS